MKKQGILMSFAILALLLFAACSSEANAPPLEELSPAPFLQTYPELENQVHMIVTDVTPTSATVTIQNDSGLPLTYGFHYTLEAYVNGQWWQVPMMELEIPIYFPDISKVISPYGSTSLSACLSHYMPLGAELYRIRKNVSIDTWLIEFMAEDELAYDVEPIAGIGTLQADEPMSDVEPVAIELADDIETFQTDESVFQALLLVGNLPELAPNPPPRTRVDTTQHEIVAEFVWNR
ncbi:MAG: hypothetical protein FWE19_07960 [Oscillospiraceae bacterium]|nr:hypothetical protein [Oscillospiraceae bacterium]